MEDNKMKKLNYTILIGIPASGKSTYSYSYVRLNKNTIRWNRDSYREMMFPKHEELYEKNLKYEKFINIQYENFIENNDYHILDDNTNLMTVQQFESKIKLLNNYNINVVLFNDSFDVESCIKRNENRERKVPETVIRRMHQKFIKNFEPIKNICNEKNIPIEIF